MIACNGTLYGHCMSASSKPPFSFLPVWAAGGLPSFLHNSLHLLLAPSSLHPAGPSPAVPSTPPSVQTELLHLIARPANLDYLAIHVLESNFVKDHNIVSLTILDSLSPSFIESLHTEPV